MDFPPIFSPEIINVDIIFFLGDILDASEHKDVIMENQHRMTSTLGWSVLSFDKLPFFVSDRKFPEIV